MRARDWGLVAATLVAAPVLAGVAYSLAASLGLAGPGAAGLSAARPLRLLADHALWSGLFFSLWVAGASTSLATAAAVLTASLFRGSGRGDRVARALAVLPLPIPHVVAGVLGVLVLGQSGYLARVGHALGIVSSPASMPALIYDRWGVGLIITLAWKEFPFVALVAISLVATRGAALEEAARTLGADASTAFRRVTWPLLWRGLMPAVVAVFVFVAGTYEATALLAPSDPLALPLLTLERYTESSLARRGDAYVLVLVGLALSGVAVALHEWTRARVERLDG